MRFAFFGSQIAVALVTARKLFGVWFPALRSVFGDLPQEFVEALSGKLDVAEKEMLFERRALELNQQKLDELVKKYPPVSRKAVAISVFTDASFAVTRHTYIAVCKHFLLAQYVKEVLA
jgi:hypothetical protein